MDQYNKIARQVRDVSQEFILNNWSTALKARMFADSMCVRLSKTMDELQEKATEIMRIEEMRTFWKRQQEEAIAKSIGGEWKA